LSISSTNETFGLPPHFSTHCTVYPIRPNDQVPLVYGPVVCDHLGFPLGLSNFSYLLVDVDVGLGRVAIVENLQDFLAI
jgi:hypothetical protein